MGNVCGFYIYIYNIYVYIYIYNIYVYIYIFYFFHLNHFLPLSLSANLGTMNLRREYWQTSYNFT